MQKRSGAGANLDRVASAFDIEPFKRADGAFGLALGVAEGREIVPADKGLRGGMHRWHVELALDEPGASSLERQWRAAVDDPVEIVAATR